MLKSRKGIEMKRLMNLNVWLLLSIVLVASGTTEALPNPAAWYCVQLGYEYQIREDAQGNQYGVCVFPDGSECDGWDYFRKCYYGGSPASCEWPCQELACREAGELVYLSECCEGLHKIRPAHTFDANCSELELVGWLFLCSDCGNGICECWESKCNCPADCGGPQIIYVDDDAAGANDGSSWADAYNYLQDALGHANSSEKPIEIRVAQGTYKPDRGAGIISGDREATFQLINHVTLKGGYAGFGEPDPNARDVNLYPTILSGDLNNDDAAIENAEDLLSEPTRAENSYRVLTGTGTTKTAVLDGLTITGGNGGGMLCHSASPTLVNCTFSKNLARDNGGGIYNFQGSPTLTNCRFIGNSASSGGGICNRYSTATLTECSFSENWAEYDGGAISNRNSSLECIGSVFVSNTAYADHGGAIANRGSSPLISDCLFEGNLAASGHGGAISNREGNPTITGCTFVANSAWNGGGLYNVLGKYVVRNCAFSGNHAFYLKVDPNGAGGRMPITGEGGGIFLVFDEGTIVQNCTFVGNRADFHGGGIYCSSNDQPLVCGCIFWNNWDASGSVMMAQVYGGESLYVPSYIRERIGCLKKCVFYSCIQGLPGTWGNGNTNKNPLFASLLHWADPNDPSSITDPNDPNAVWIHGDYHLKSQAGRWDANEGRWVMDEVTSPCIDAGNPSRPIGHDLFPNGGIINMGAYGGTAEASKSYFGEPVCETIVAGDINGDCKIDFLDFELMALHWLEDNNH